MNWIKKDNTQIMTACGHEVVLEKRRSMYWATCYRLDGNAKIKKFTFPPRKRIGELKLLVEMNKIFSETEQAQKVFYNELTQELWWQK